MKVTEKTRSTIQITNQLTHKLSTFRDSDEMKIYVRNCVFGINQERGSMNLPDIELNDVYKILGESYTCFWGFKDE